VRIPAAPALALVLAFGCTPKIDPPPPPEADPGAAFSFAVIGDNRGDASGQLTPAFQANLRALRRENVSFTLHTGDMIYGKTNDVARVQAMWKIYRDAIASLPAPVFHVPGSHDIWDEWSARLYRKVVGPTYYAFDHGSARFIALDTESTCGRLDSEQFRWLEEQLNGGDSRIAFLFFHQPLFPVDGHIGSSLDAYPEDRDRLHRLFVRHRDRIRGVFLGHEHLYHFEERDGVPYHTVGGGGSPLYAPPDLGGFHHYLVVRVSGREATVEVRKTLAFADHPYTTRRIQRGDVLEGWEGGLFWYPWDYTVVADITEESASHGQRALRMNFDTAQCGWPVLFAPLPPGLDIGDADALTMDVYVPTQLQAGVTVTPGVEAATQREGSECILRPGWNTIQTRMDELGLTAAEKGALQNASWTLTADREAIRSAILFDRFGLVRRRAGNPEVIETLDSWESGILWRVWNESVTEQASRPLATEGSSGRKVQFDFAQCRRPMLCGRLNPRWDLRGVETLSVDAYLPEDFASPLSVGLALAAADRTYTAAPAPLRAGWNTVAVQLDGGWLPDGARAAIEQVEWVLSSTIATNSGWIAFDNLRAK
jgi:hypothetical protein